MADNISLFTLISSSRVGKLHLSPMKMPKKLVFEYFAPFVEPVKGKGKTGRLPESPKMNILVLKLLIIQLDFCIFMKILLN